MYILKLPSSLSNWMMRSLNMLAVNLPFTRLKYTSTSCLIFYSIRGDNMLPLIYCPNPTYQYFYPITYLLVFFDFTHRNVYQF